MSQEKKKTKMQKSSITHAGFRKKFFIILRASLVLSILLNIGIGAFVVLQDGDVKIGRAHV